MYFTTYVTCTITYWHYISQSSFVTELVSIFHNQPKKLYYNSYLNGLTKSKFLSETVIQNSEPISDNMKIANIFNSFFISTFTNSTFTLPPLILMYVLPQPTNYTKSTFPLQAFGCDNIHAKVLHCCVLALTESIKHLFKFSLQNIYVYPSQMEDIIICINLAHPKERWPYISKYNYRPTVL